MRILVAVDRNTWSENAAHEAAKLALNTWADMTFVGVHTTAPAKRGDSSGSVAGPPIHTALHRYRENFLKSAEHDESPYALTNWMYEWVPLKNGLWEEMLVCRGARKDCRVHLRVGDMAAEILAEAKEEESDLIVLGCPKGEPCFWDGSLPVPQDVVNKADRSVLLVKEKQPVTGILACLDQTHISQNSREIINQMATIHGAPLQLIGLSQNGSMKKKVYRQLIELGDYYEERRIKATIHLTDIADFERFLAEKLDQELLALWMGQKSLLDRFFPRDWAGRFITKCQGSVLVMR